MIAFVVSAAVMAAIALAWVLVPLLRRRHGAGVERDRVNLAILRDQRRELESDLANGVVTSDQYDAAVAELDRRVLEEAKLDAQAPASTPPRAGKLTAVLVGIAIPVVAAALYVLLGTPQALSPEFVQQAQQEAGGQGGHDISPAELDALLANLAERLKSEPDNAEGWAVLARSYMARGKVQEAATAFERATTLLPNDAALLADYADALGVVQGRSLQGRPTELIQRALKADPTQWKALALAGTAAFNSNDFAKAAEYWTRAKATVPPTSPFAQSMDESIAEARQRGGLPPLAATPAPAAPPAMAAAAPAPRAAPAPNAAANPAAAIAGTVALSPAVAASVKPDDLVVIFARPAQGGRMPLALVQKQVKDLPAKFTLDDSNAMTPDMTISKVGEVVVGARVSRSGSPMPQSGDLEGVSGPVKAGTKGLSVVIDKTLP